MPRAEAQATRLSVETLEPCSLTVLAMVRSSSIETAECLGRSRGARLGSKHDRLIAAHDIAVHGPHIVAHRLQACAHQTKERRLEVESVRDLRVAEASHVGGSLHVGTKV